MKKLLMGLVGFGTFLQAASVSETPRTYVYRLKGIPPNERNCHERARELGTRFSEITGLEASGVCESISDKGIAIQIRYLATEPVEGLSSAADIGFPGQGFEFATRRECEAKIPEETKFFEQATGKKSLLAFCNFRENYYGLQRWALVIYGFGKAGFEPQWSSSLFPGSPTADQARSILSDVKNKLNHSQLNVRFPFLQQDEHGHLRLTVMYFGKYGEQLKSFSLAEVNSLGECETEMQELRQLQQLNSEITTLGYCVNNPYHRGADLVAIVDVTRWYQIRQAVESFSGYEDCQKQKRNLIAFYQEELKQSVLAGFCTQWGPHWKLSLVEARTRR